MARSAAVIKAPKRGRAASAAKPRAKATVTKKVRERSTATEPTKIVWDICKRLGAGKGYPRKVIIAACEAAGVHPGTAAKQYNDWKNEQKAK